MTDDITNLQSVIDTTITDEQAVTVLHPTLQTMDEVQKTAEGAHVSVRGRLTSVS